MLGLALGAGALVVAGGAYLSPHAFRAAAVSRLAMGCARDRTLILTYDDGPGPKLTPQLLALLGASQAKATFFLLGFRAEAAPDVADRIVAEGHEAACHSFAHLHAWKRMPWTCLRDIQRGYSALSRWVDRRALFRPPYGKMVLPTWLATRFARRPIGWWTLDGGDTHEVLPEPQSIADAVRRAGGGVVLLHDFDRQREGSTRAEFVLQTTDLLVRTANEEGLRIRRFGDYLKDVACHRLPSTEAASTANLVDSKSGAGCAELQLRQRGARDGG